MYRSAFINYFLREVCTPLVQGKVTVTLTYVVRLLRVHLSKKCNIVVHAYTLKAQMIIMYNNACTGLWWNILFLPDICTHVTQVYKTHVSSWCFQTGKCFV